MGKPTGFKEFNREMPARRPVSLRVSDYQDCYTPMPEDKLRTQGARCMDCGVPYCNNGCPLGNLIPTWNDRVYHGRFEEALNALHKTNNFPEFTGQICPAPCEESCTLNLWKTPVTIKLIEYNIVDRGFKEGWIKPRPPEKRTGKKVAVIGSGPAGLAAAAQLNKAGHLVTVFERADRIGGLLTYGIPNFKLEKWIVDRRVKLLEAEGITFKTSANVGVNISVEDLRKEFDAMLLCLGSTDPRDLKVPGRELKGIYPAMDFLPQATKSVLGDSVKDQISAKGKHVVVIGGGDTGADCVGTSVRQGAASVRQLELMPRPPEKDNPDTPWPVWPMILRSSTSHEEAASKLNGGAEVRDWSVNTRKFEGADGVVKKLHGVRLEWAKGADGRMSMKEVAGTEFELDCDLCLLAMGFVGPERPGLLQQLGVDIVDRMNTVKVDANYMSSVPGVFAAGDARRGQSLVVWAISEGRCAAHKVDAYLMGHSDLPFLKLY